MALQMPIPQSTLSDWCSQVELTVLQAARLEARKWQGGERGRIISRAMMKVKREEYFIGVHKRIAHLGESILNHDAAKIAIAMLYLGEGGKRRTGGLFLGNSDPKVIALFLFLLRHSYTIDEGKFRCTLQCRADQNIEKLEVFWSEITKIPLSRFYKARIDPRTIGKPSTKPDYKGVCKINYFSADLFYELMEIANVVCMGR